LLRAPKLSKGHHLVTSDRFTGDYIGDEIEQMRMAMREYLQNSRNLEPDRYALRSIAPR